MIVDAVILVLVGLLIRLLYKGGVTVKEKKFSYFARINKLLR